MLGSSPPYASFDIETVPPSKESNPEAWAEAEDKAKRSRKGHDAAYYLSVDADALNTCCFCGHDSVAKEYFEMFAKNQDEEQELVERAWGWLKSQSYNGRLLTSFNGRSFDIPALHRRALVHDVFVAPKFASQIMGKPRNGSDKVHLDLMSALSIPSPFGASEVKSFDYYLRLFGIGSKPEGWDGSKVYPAFKQGFLEPGYWEDIQLYCRSDVDNLSALFERVAPWLVDFDNQQTAATEKE